MSESLFTKIKRRLVACAAISAAFTAFTSGPASDANAAELELLEVFATPSIGTDGMWVAEAQGLFKEVGLEVKIRLFPSGTTAFQTFKTGAGDVIFSGDLPALQYWQNGGSYRVIAPSNRDSGGYIAVTRKDIKTPQDLAGKTIATRVGSTGSWFVSEYLTKNGIEEKSVSIRNLDPPLMPVALCQGDIDGFFIWLPAPMKALQICADKVHYLSTADGYIKGYSVIGARAEYVTDAKNADKLVRFLRALRKGAEIAAAEPAQTEATLIKRFGFTPEEIKAYQAITERVLKFDTAFFDDFCSENKWQQRAGLRNAPSDLSQWVWDEGLKTIDPTLVVAAPPPC
jgi:ABC-type nitrate/sulfonate/bicarbonate transport system substrate-binding protein